MLWQDPSYCCYWKFAKHQLVRPKLNRLMQRGHCNREIEPVEWPNITWVMRTEWRWLTVSTATVLSKWMPSRTLLRTKKASSKLVRSGWLWWVMNLCRIPSLCSAGKALRQHKSLRECQKWLFWLSRTLSCINGAMHKNADCSQPLWWSFIENLWIWTIECAQQGNIADSITLIAVFFLVQSVHSRSDQCVNGQHRVAVTTGCNA